MAVPPTSRNLLIGLLLSLGSLMLCAAVVVGADLYLHWKYREEALNVRGYRGPLLGAKAPGELRLAVLGGSTAYGYKVRTGLSVPALLQELLVEQLDRPVTIANLAYNNESAVCFAPTLQRYAYLEPDGVLLYSGYNDVGPGMYYRQPSDCYRQRSLVFRLTGYFPVLPLYAEEKYFSLRYGSVEQGYLEDQTLTQARSWFSGLAPEPRVTASLPPPPADLAAAQRARYVSLVTDVIAAQLEAGRAIIFVTQPYISQDHRQQQAQLRSALERFQTSPLFRYVDLGETIDLRDRTLAYDGMHLTVEGNRLIAAALLHPVAEHLRSLAASSPR